MILFENNGFSQVMEWSIVKMVISIQEIFVINNIICYLYVFAGMVLFAAGICTTASSLGLLLYHDGNLSGTENLSDQTFKEDLQIRILNHLSNNWRIIWKDVPFDSMRDIRVLRLLIFVVGQFVRTIKVYNYYCIYYVRLMLLPWGGYP